ncbi:MAG: SpoIIE family protein phosphatase [Gammaproteobacteria bacterium]|nr:SpoIIE family protein phosphatase [Gammaproteobacteria bacterium]
MQYVIARSSRLGNRTINQDRVAALERDNTVMLVLGDGLGGKAGGEVAAQVMVDTIANAFKRVPLPISNPKEFLTDVLHLAHHAVIAAGKKVDPPINPGTTAVLCLVQDGSAWWAHVGDSRLYLFRGGVPIYRTRDHSFVEKLVERGHLSNDDRSTHPLRNYMTRCIGLSNSVPEVSVSNEVALHAGDVIMLCSDGMWEPIDEMQLGMKLLDGRLSDALDKLAQQAEEINYPSSDNISAVAIQIMSLQLIGRAINDGIDKQVAHAAQLDPVENAIDVIEQTFKLYEHEMK